MIHTARRLRRLAVALGAAAALSLLTTGVVDLASTARPAHADAGPIVDDYPYRGQSSGVDPWNFYKGQCTSFAAWRLNDRIGIDFTNQYRGEHFGNANTWDDAARRAGLTVSSTPRPGAIAQSDAGSFGHVAWVARVNADATVLIEEYNWTRPSGYGTRTVSASSFEYIYFGNPPAVNLAAESVNGDRYEDLLAVDSGNVLWSYPGRSGGTLGTAVRIGAGWIDNYNRIAVGDSNIVGIKKADNTLIRWTGDGDGTFATPTQIGHGWSTFRLANY